MELEESEGSETKRKAKKAKKNEENDNDDDDDDDDDEKIQSDQNIISRFVYRHLNENEGKLPSDMIVNIMKKSFENISSYYAKKEKGLKANIPKFIEKDGMFILPFFARSFRAESDIVRLTIGKHTARNYVEITGNGNLVCLNMNDRTELKKYIDKKYLTKKKKGERILKVKNFIVGDEYVSKDHEKIINANFLYIGIPNKLSTKKIKQIEINPLYKGEHFKINYTYDTVEIKTENKKTTDPKKCISIDLGINNLMTIYDPNGLQKIIKGRTLVSLNNHYNHKISNIKSKRDKLINESREAKKDEIIKLNKIYYKLEIKRKNKIDDYFNKTVKYMENEYSSKEKIIVGYNLNWKNGVKMGRANNRKFYGIPFRKLLFKLKDKFGEKIITTEESYTSKCDALKLEEICKKRKYSGKRIRRGLFSSGLNKLLNADLNGAINIMRKVIKLDKITGDKLFNPITVKISR